MHFHNFKSKTVIIIGFTVVMFLLLALAAVSVHDFRVNDDKLANVGDELSQVKAVFEMREVVYERALVLYRMLEISDPFTRNEELNHFQMLATRYTNARDTLLQKKFDEDEPVIWQQLKRYINRNGELQNKVIDLILGDKVQQARKLLVNEVIPVQGKAMQQLTRLFEAERASAGEPYQEEK